MGMEDGLVRRGCAFSCWRFCAMSSLSDEEAVAVVIAGVVSGVKEGEGRAARRVRGGVG